ncbi:MAG: tripartite tricarboxylate transporter substrate binding protein [Betaproteobacteria bacterium]|nr:tripartite tricarboxylate transporter substrate binding protein [Betaproteobacteria bacterium]
MKGFLRSLLHASLLALCTLLAPISAMAQAYPSRPVTLINPYPPGGGADVLARALARELSEIWRQPVIIESKPGAGTTIAAAYVARANPDGYTLLLSTSQHAIAPALFKNLSYDIVTHLTSIALASESPLFLVVRPDRGISSMGELMTKLKQNSAAMNYSSSGLASLPHLAGAFLNQMTGSSATHIPFTGLAPALTALLGGQVDYLFADTSAVPHIHAGKVRALAVSSPTRLPSFPDLPTLGESLPGFQFTVWTGLDAPSGTPRAVIDQVHDAVQKALAAPAMKKLYLETARTPSALSPDQFAAFKAGEVQKYQKLSREAGIKAE